MNHVGLCLLFLVVLAMSGCLNTGPIALSPGAKLPLEVVNGFGHPILVDVFVREAYGDTELSSSSLGVEPGQSVRAQTPRLPYGKYGLLVSHGDLERDVVAAFNETTRFHRFVIQPDVIAFQSG